jgi:hypothetical protein
MARDLDDFTDRRRKINAYAAAIDGQNDVRDSLLSLF